MQTTPIPFHDRLMFRIVFWWLVVFLTCPAIAANTALPWNLSQLEREEISAWFNQMPKGNSPSQWKPVAPRNPELENRLRKRLAELEAAMDSLPKDEYGKPPADVDVWRYTVALLLENGEWRYPKRVDYMELCLDWCAALIEQHKRDADFSSRLRGRFALGYRSRVDRSVQPYLVTLPPGFRPDNPEPCGVQLFLHGLMRWRQEPVWIADGMLNAKLADDDDIDTEPDNGEQQIIRVQPFGRLDMFYSGAGEIDVLEVIEDVSRRYPIDPDRIAITGFSMGGGGTLKISLQYPDLFSCTAPLGMAVFGADPRTEPWDYESAFAPLNHEAIAERLRVPFNMGELAANARGLPVLMGVGTKDRLSEGHRHFEKLFDQAGVDFYSYYVGGLGHTPGPLYTDHYYDFLNNHVREAFPKTVSYATAHLRHAKKDWIQIEGLRRHYQLAKVEAAFDEKTKTINVKTEGITCLSILAERNPLSNHPSGRLVLDGDAFDISLKSVDQLSFHHDGSHWRTGHPDTGLRKKPGLTGPIEDAIMSPFLVVEPTGKAWSPLVTTWSAFQLERMKNEWCSRNRGFLPVKKDTEITPEDRKRYHLILLGDPGSNQELAKVLSQAGKSSFSVPLRWSRDEIEFMGTRYAGENHVPVVVYPNPQSPDRYVVINGRYFAEDRYASFLPREDSDDKPAPVVGDFAILELPSDPQEKETMVLGGFFDEKWGLTY